VCIVEFMTHVMDAVCGGRCWTLTLRSCALCLCHTSMSTLASSVANTFKVNVHSVVLCTACTALTYSCAKTEFLDFLSRRK